MGDPKDIKSASSSLEFLLLAGDGEGQESLSTSKMDLFALPPAPFFTVDILFLLEERRDFDSDFLVDFLGVAAGPGAGDPIREL